MGPRTPSSTLFPYTTLFRSQRGDFVGIFREMAGFPVTIRLLDPPLHEFLPNVDELLGERSEEHTSELQSRGHLVCRLLLEKKNGTEPGQAADRVDRAPPRRS